MNSKKTKGQAIMDGLSFDGPDYSTDSEDEDCIERYYRIKREHREANDSIQQQIREGGYSDKFSRSRQAVSGEINVGNICHSIKSGSQDTITTKTQALRKALIDFNKEIKKQFDTSNPFSLYFKLLRLVAICAHCRIYYTEKTASLNALGNLIQDNPQLFAYVHHCLTILYQHASRRPAIADNTAWHKVCEAVGSRLEYLYSRSELIKALRFAVLLELRLSTTVRQTSGVSKAARENDSTSARLFDFSQKTLLPAEVWANAESRNAVDRDHFLTTLKPINS
jgi:hypothetical protein